MSTLVQLEYKTAYIRPARNSDSVEVGKNMRTIDKLECLLSDDASPSDAVQKGIDNDYRTWTICAKDNDEPLACFGIGELLEDEYNYIWLLATDRLLDVAGLEFARASKAWVSHLVNQYGLPCVNNVHVDNTVAIRWLKWCGADFPEYNDVTSTDGLMPFQINPSYLKE